MEDFFVILPRKQKVIIPILLRSLFWEELQLALKTQFFPNFNSMQKITETFENLSVPLIFNQLGRITVGFDSIILPQLCMKKITETLKILSVP